MLLSMKLLFNRIKNAGKITDNKLNPIIHRLKIQIVVIEKEFKVFCKVNLISN